MLLFLEGRGEAVLTNYGSADYAPIEAGLNFRM